MSAHARHVVRVVLVLCVTAALGCGGATSTPASPSTTVSTPLVPPSSLLNDPNAIAIQLDQAVTGVIGADGPWCSLFDPMDSSAIPCQTYRLNLARATTLKVHVTWSAPNQDLCAMFGRAGYYARCTKTSPADASFVVGPGTVAFAVGYEGSGADQPIPPGAKVEYSVSASIATPVVAAGGGQ